MPQTLHRNPFPVPFHTEDGDEPEMVTIAATTQSPWAKPVSQEPGTAPWLSQIAKIADKRRPDQGDPETLPPHLIQEFQSLQDPANFPDKPGPTADQTQWLACSLAEAYEHNQTDQAWPVEISWDLDGSFVLYWRIGNRFIDLELNADNYDGILLVYNIDQAEEAWKHPINMGCLSCWHNLAEMTISAAADE